jgi:hypothetical protein
MILAGNYANMKHNLNNYSDRIQIFPQSGADRSRFGKDPAPAGPESPRKTLRRAPGACPRGRSRLELGRPGKKLRPETHRDPLRYLLQMSSGQRHRPYTCGSASVRNPCTRKSGSAFSGGLRPPPAGRGEDKTRGSPGTRTTVRPHLTGPAFPPYKIWGGYELSDPEPLPPAMSAPPADDRSPGQRLLSRTTVSRRFRSPGTHAARASSVRPAPAGAGAATAREVSGAATVRRNLRRPGRPYRLSGPDAPKARREAGAAQPLRAAADSSPVTGIRPASGPRGGRDVTGKGRD